MSVGVRVGVCVRACVYAMIEGGEGTEGSRAGKGEGVVCGWVWEMIRKDI